jgi:ribosomal protein S18 acetylase RimI-like enzyme
MSYYCSVTGLTVTQENASKWTKLIKIYGNTPGALRMMNRYGAKSVEQFSNLIKKGIDDDTINDMVNAYMQKRDNLSIINDKIEKNQTKKLIANSKKVISKTVCISMLSEENQEDAFDLYVQFKQSIGDDYDQAFEHVQDFIIKNIMFGLFVAKRLVGFVVVKKNRKFQTDMSDEEDTYYIQDIFVDQEYRSKGFGKLLIDYCQTKSVLKTMSLMVMPQNISMIALVKKCGFVKQKVGSGDNKHCLLMIKYLSCM